MSGIVGWTSREVFETAENSAMPFNGPFAVSISEAVALPADFG
jgi:hypothetical protein